MSVVKINIKKLVAVCASLVDLSTGIVCSEKPCV